MTKESNPVGRPPRYKTPEAMKIIIDDYFENRESDDSAWFMNGDKQEYRPTISGLAYALGLSTQAVRDYEEKDEFLGTIKEAKLKVERALEERLYGNNVTGLIFNLKNNFKWKDSQQIEVTDDKDISGRLMRGRQRMNEDNKE